MAKRFLSTAIVLGVLAWLVKGRDLGLPLWVSVLGFAVYSGAALLIGYFFKRDGDD